MNQRTSVDHVGSCCKSNKPLILNVRVVGLGGKDLCFCCTTAYLKYKRTGDTA